MNRAAANIHVQASVWARVVRSGGCILRSGARVQPRQDPGGTLRMNGVGKRERGRERERRHMRPALIGPSLRGRERERERERENDQMGVFAGSGRVWQCFIFYHSFYTLS